MTKDQFLRLLEEAIEEEPGSLASSTELVDIEMWDSMAVMSFIAMADESFGMELPPGEIGKCKTVDDLVVLLGDNVAG